MKGISLAVLLWLSLCMTSFGQQNPGDSPATREDVEQYLQVTHSRELMQQTVQAISAPMHQMFHDEFVKNQGKLPPDFEAEMTRQMDDMLKNMPWEEVLQAMIPSYEKHFSKDDLQALTAFYSSPRGQKILREMPAVTAEAMQDAMPLMQSYMQSVTQRMKQVMEARLRDADKTPPKSSPAKH